MRIKEACEVLRVIEQGSDNQIDKKMIEELQKITPETNIYEAIGRLTFALDIGARYSLASDFTMSAVDRIKMGLREDLIEEIENN